MKSIILGILFILAMGTVKAQYGYLNANDQKFYKNDSMDGNNQRERIDSTVKEINKLYAEINSLKAEVKQLRTEVDELKSKK